MNLTFLCIKNDGFYLPGGVVSLSSRKNSLLMVKHLFLCVSSVRKNFFIYKKVSSSVRDGATRQLRL